MHSTFTHKRPKGAMLGCEQVNFQVLNSIFKVIRAKECSYGGVGSVCGGKGEVRWTMGGAKPRWAKKVGARGEEVPTGG